MNFKNVVSIKKIIAKSLREMIKKIVNSKWTTLKIIKSKFFITDES